MAPRQCEIHSKPQPLLWKTCISYAFETLAAYAGMCACVRRLWPTYVGHGPCAQAEGYFGHFISKNRFFFSHLKGYIFHFNTPQVNMISNWALNWSWASKFEHHWGMGARVIRGKKYGVYRCPTFDL